VDREQLLAFAHRDWSQVAEAKTAFWREAKRDQSVADLLAVGDLLRRHAQAVRPDWPSARDRAEDLAVHLRVSEALRAVAIRPR